jgi:hypothetical protein
MIFVSDAAQFERIAGHLRAKIATKYGTKRIKINIYNNFKTGSKKRQSFTGCLFFFYTQFWKTFIFEDFLQSF